MTCFYLYHCDANLLLCRPNAYNFVIEPFRLRAPSWKARQHFSDDQTRLTRLPAMAEGASSSYCVRKYILTFKNLQVASYFEQLSHHNNVFSLKHPIFEGEKK